MAHRQTLYNIHVCVDIRGELEVSLSSAREEAGRREREWEEERERRETTEQGLNQQVTQLQTSLSSVQKEKAEASPHS